MTQRKLTLLGAAVLGAMLSMSAGAEDRNLGGMPDSANRIPSLNQPSSVPDAQPSDTGRQYQSPLVRDYRFRASPITPASPNESNPSAMFDDRTNDGGMGRRWGYGGTR